MSRLDRREPIFWMVAVNEADRRAYFCISESTLFSGLYVDGDGRLALVDPDLKNEDLEPACACCTHTFNGVLLVKKYQVD